MTLDDEVFAFSFISALNEIFNRPNIKIKVGSTARQSCRPKKLEGSDRVFQQLTLSASKNLGCLLPL